MTNQFLFRNHVSLYWVF